MKLVVVTSRFPYPLEKGDKLRVYHQIRLLSQKHDIVLISLTERNVPESDLKELRKFCSNLYLLPLKRWRIGLNLIGSLFNKTPLQVAYFYDRNLVEKTYKILNIEQPDHIFSQLIRTAEYVKDTDFPKTLDYMDAFSAITHRWARKAPWPLSVFWKHQASKLMQYESDVYDHFNHHLIISEPDRDILNFGKERPLRVIGNGVDPDYFRPKNNSQKQYDIAFIGNMGYLPNVEAAKYLVSEILPLVKMKMPEVKVLLAGARPSRVVKKLAGPSVKVTGWIEDIRSAYESSRLFVAPIFLGAGMQNKILEAMCMRVPCVTTSRVNNAIKATHRTSIIVSDTAEELAQAILELLENDSLSKSISDAAYDFALSNFSWEATVNQLETIVFDYGKQIQHHS